MIFNSNPLPRNTVTSVIQIMISIWQETGYIAKLRLNPNFSLNSSNWDQ